MTGYGQILSVHEGYVYEPNLDTAVFLYSVRLSATGVFLFNLCGSLLALSICYIISNYVVINMAACQAFSFFLQFTLLLSCGSIAIFLFFMVYTPYTGEARRIAFTAAIVVNLGEFIY